MPESSSVDLVTRIVAELHPKVIAFGASDWTPEIIRIAKDSGAELYVDRQGSDKSGPTDNPARWQAAIDAGADGIQTDRPAELVKYLPPLMAQSPCERKATGRIENEGLDGGRSRARTADLLLVRQAL